MLQKLIAFSIRYAGLVVMAAGLLVAFTGVQLGRMPVDVFPELNAPTVVVLTEAGGFAADEVEQYVTVPVERAMSGIPKVEEVRSLSKYGLSVITVVFTEDTDIYFARQMVSERMRQAEEAVPAHYGRPAKARSGAQEKDPQRTPSFRLQETASESEAVCPESLHPF